MTINIVYENQDFLVINKSSGISVHKTHAKDSNKTLIDLVLEKYPEIKNVGEDLLRPGVVHRLDKETSGLMIVAKNQKSFEYFKNLFQKRLIKKTYLALVHGKPKNIVGIIDTPLGKIGTKQTTRIKGKKDLKERMAVTEYKVLKTYLPASRLPPARTSSRRSRAGGSRPWQTSNLKPIIYSLLEVSPKTGRTHQIRAHLNSIGYPVVCDALYGSKKGACPLELGRLFLHAQKLEFTSPSGQRFHLEVELPNELTNFLNSLTMRSSS